MQYPNDVFHKDFDLSPCIAASRRTPLPYSYRDQQRIDRGVLMLASKKFTEEEVRQQLGLPQTLLDEVKAQLAARLNPSPAKPSPCKSKSKPKSKAPRKIRRAK